jgi:hypothetical protein
MGFTIAARRHAQRWRGEGMLELEVKETTVTASMKKEVKCE